MKYGNGKLGERIVETIRKRRTFLVSLSAMVVFVTTYLLILPAITLDQDTAKDQGGIDLPAAEQVQDVDQSADTDKTAAETPSAGELSYEGDGYTVEAAFDAKAGLPEDTELAVTEIASKDKDYDTWRDEALKAVQEAKGGEQVTDLKFAKFYDISLMADGQAIEPEAPVDISISYDKALKAADADHVRIIHFGTDENGDLVPEVLASDDVDLDLEKGKMSSTAFAAESFSVYGVVCTKELEAQVLTDSGKTYTVTVSFDESAAIPENAELKVREITKKDEDFEAYYEEAVKAADAGSTDYARFFDIEITAEGQKIEPASEVAVNITLTDAPEGKMTNLKVVHFGADGPEVLETEKDEEAKGGQTGLNFVTDEFSVYTIVNAADLDSIVSGGPYALVSGHSPGISTPDSNGNSDILKYALTSTTTDFQTNDGRTVQTVTGKTVYFDSVDRTYGGDVSEWNFEPVISGGTTKYRIYTDSDGERKYLMSDANSVGITTSEDRAYLFTLSIIDGRLCIQIDWENWRVTSQNVGNSRSMSRFVTTNNTDAGRTLFTLASLDPDFEEKAAKKVSAADWKGSEENAGSWNENDTVVIYRRIEHADGSEELYVLATDGSLIPAYDGGDSIFYHCPEDKNVNWHVALGASGYYISNVIPDGSEESTVYLAPSVTNGTWSSDSPVGLVLGGMGNTYGTSIENWDQAAYAYAGLHVDAANGSTLAQGITPGSGTSSDTFLFAVSDTLISKGELHKVDTVDSTSKGITMKIFNYSGPVYNWGYRNAAMQAVMGNDMTSDWDNRKSHVTRTVSQKLGEDGFPVSLSEGYGSYADLFTNGARIDYPGRGDGYPAAYDDGSITVEGRDANNLFLQSYYDENGMFRYSSMENFAHFNITDDEENNVEAGNFTVYRETGTPNIPTESDHYYYYHGHFMPYNNLDKNVSISRIVDQYGSITDKEMGRSFEDVYGLSETPDYYVGMTLAAKFVQPSGGTLENGDPVVYKFTGDDDLLVYIDGILVLDVGGIHEPLTGSINFETGTVIQPNFYNEGDGWGTHTTTLYEIFRDAYRNGLISAEDWAKIKWTDADGDGEYDTFEDHTTHTFNMFYLERGAGASNLDLQFNLQVVKKDEFTVRKNLPEGVKPEFVNQLYRFRAYFIDDTDNNRKKPLYPGAEKSDGTVVCSKVTYADLKNAAGKPVEKNVPFDETDHSFVLKAGEAAVFTMASEEIVYDVCEAGIDGSLIEQVDINGVSTAIDPQEGPAEVYAGEESVEDRSEVNVTNHPKTQNLRVTKHITEDSLSGWEEDNPVFEFRVYLEQLVTDGNGDIVYEDVTDEETGDTVQKPKTKLVPYSRSPYYLVKIPEGQEDNEAAWEYYTLTGENNTPVPQPHGTVCSITGRSGTINSIPPEYTIIIPNLAVGTHFYVEERRVNIPEGYEFDHEKLKDGTYDPSTLGASKENIAQIMTIDQYSNNEEMYFDAESVGRIKAGTAEERKDAEFDVWNRKPAIEVPVKKEWSGGTTPRPDVTLALIRYMPQEKYTPPVGQGAIIIEHIADYGEHNNSTTLPSGFVATYTIEKYNVATESYEVVAADTSGPFDVDPGTYRVSTVVNNRGNEPADYTYDKTDPVTVKVQADESTVATIRSEYKYEQGGQITIVHNAAYDGGELTGSDLPNGFAAAYTIKDESTNRIVHRNVPAGTYDVPAGKYTVTANISDSAAPESYVYESTTTAENVTVTSGGSVDAALTSSYVYVAPKTYGYITVSHESAGLKGTSPDLPQNFQVTSYRIIGPTTINNAQLGHEYEVEAGEYTVVANVNYAPVVDGYVYVGTPAQDVVIGTDDHKSVKLTSTYGKQGAIRIVHKYEGISGTDALPAGMSVQYKIVNNATGETVRDNVAAGTYSVPAGEYTVSAHVYSTGTAPDGYYYLDTDPATVTVTGEETVDANVVSRYGANGSITIVHESSGLAGSPTELPSTFQVRYIIKDATTGETVNNGDSGTGPHSVAPGRYIVTAHIDYQVPPTGYTYIDDGDNEDSVTVDVESGQETTATVVSSYNPPQNLTYTLTGTWKDKNGNTLPASEWPNSGSVTVPIIDAWSQPVGTFILSPDNNWTGTASLVSGGGHGYYKLDTNKVTKEGTGVDSISFDVTSLSDSEAGSFTYNGVVKPNTATVYLHVGTSVGTSATSLTVPKGSTLTLSYHSYQISQYNTLNPGWELYYLGQYSWSNANQQGSMPTDGSVDITIGEEDVYCVLIKTHAGTADDYGASLVVKQRSSLPQANNKSPSLLRQAVRFIKSGLRGTPAESEVDPSTLNIPASITETISTKNQELIENAAGYEYLLDTSFGKQVVLSDPWSYTFDDLEELGEGEHPYYYALVEVEVPDDYEVSYGQNPISASDIKNNMDEIAAANKHNTDHPDDPVPVPDQLTLTAINTSTNPATGSLELTKKVAGTGANQNKEFAFKVDLTAPAGTTLDESYHVLKTGEEETSLTLERTEENTKASIAVSLKDGQSWEIKDLPVGTSYVITETDYSKDGYTQSVTKGNKTGTIPGGVTKTEVEFTNTYSAVDVKIIKIDEGTRNSDHQTLLPQAKFKLYRYTTPEEGTQGTYTVYPDESSCEMTTNASGELTFNKLPNGKYMIEESEAPAGYIKQEDLKIYFTVSEGSTLTYTNEAGETIASQNLVSYTPAEKTFTVGNTPGVALPNTGGPGTQLFTILGSILILGAGVLLWRRRRTI